jgi:cytochrome c553
MRERTVIIASLALFLVLLTSPVWYAKAAGTTASPPELKRPATETVCVLPVDQIRASHMTLLVSWRDDVVRRQDRSYVSPDGKTYAKSLTGTCLRCHSNKAEFCDRCHAYANVVPYCWDCHVDPASLQRSRP